MQQTTFETITVPAAGSTPANVAVARAPKGHPVRVVIRNIGPVLVFLAGSAADITGPEPSTKTFRLPAGAETVFVLAPQQALYAAAIGGGVVTVSVSMPISVTVDGVRP